MLNHSRRVHPLVLVVSLVLAVGVSVCSLVADEFGKPDAQAQRVSNIVSRLLDQHLSNRKLNDAISRRALNVYLKTLDPMKMYFMKSDIEEFKQWETQIDDYMKDGEYAAAFGIFKRFLKRIDQRVELAVELIHADHDFTIDEEMVTDRDMIDYADSDMEARERWRKRIKYNLLVYQNDKSQEEASSDEDGETPTVIQDPKERLEKRYRSFANRMSRFDNEDVIEMYITAITNSFDPHTSYMSPSTYENFQITMRLELEGIGATLQSTDDGLTVIRRIVPGGAADKHGKLKVEDKIAMVGQGDSGEMVDVTDMKLDDVVGLIRGKAGTTVRLGVMSPGSNDLKTISIVRERIELKDSEAAGVVFDVGKNAAGEPFQIGVIDLPSFYADMAGANRNVRDYKSTTRDVRNILNDFKQAGVDAVVLDLRRNGGGSLREAIDCSGLFIDNGPVVQVKGPYGQIDSLNDENFGMAWEGPLVVLVSKFSASASEILAGAVQDYGRGLVVGDSSTHGKGTVQTLLNLNQVLYNIRNAPPTLGALKITIQQFYRPNGDSTQKRGVLSDIVLPSISDHMDVGEADLEYPVEFDHVPKASFTSMNMVSGELVKQLAQRSADRISASEDFQRQLRRIDTYVNQKEAKTVSLNERVFNERRKEFDADKEDEKAIEDQLNHTNADIKRDYYMDEVLNIAVDYVQSIAGEPLARKN